MNSPNDPSSATGKTETKPCEKKISREQNPSSLERLVRRIIFLFTPVYHSKYDERHVAVYGMTALQKIAQELENKAKEKKEKANA